MDPRLAEVQSRYSWRQCRAAVRQFIDDILGRSTAERASGGLRLRPNLRRPVAIQIRSARTGRHEVLGFGFLPDRCLRACAVEISPGGAERPEFRHRRARGVLKRMEHIRNRRAFLEWGTAVSWCLGIRLFKPDAVRK